MTRNDHEVPRSAARRGHDDPGRSPIAGLPLRRIALRSTSLLKNPGGGTAGGREAPGRLEA